MTENIINQFIEAMSGHGCAPAKASDIVPDDKFHDIQGEADPRGKKKVFYILNIIDGFGYGQFGHRVTGERVNWHSNSDIEMDDREREELNKKIQEQKERKEKELKITRAEAAAEAEKRYKSADVASPDNPYLKSKGITPSKRMRQEGDSLLTPIFKNGKIVSLQTISPNGFKKYLPGGEKQGGYFFIDGEDGDVTVICEGVSTGRSINMATDHPVFCAYDKGNLKNIAVALRKKFPDKKLVIAADDDQWKINHNKKPEKIDADDLKMRPGDDPIWSELAERGLLKNEGLEAAKQAAVKAAAFTVTPGFPPNHKEKPTDFNDLHAIIGLNAVKKRIAMAGHPGKGNEGAGVTNNIPVVGVQDPGTGDKQGSQHKSSDSSALEAYDYQQKSPIDSYLRSEAPDHPVGDLGGLPFKILGINMDGNYCYYPFGKQQIVTMTPQQHMSMGHLLQLASLNQWEGFVSPSGRDTPTNSTITKIAADALMRASEERGTFSEENRVRSCGAWLDAGRSVLHCGDYVYVDGVKMKPSQIASQYVYVKSPPLLNPDAKPLDKAEAYRLAEICDMLSWEHRLSGVLLSGWLVVAPVCGALEWRPHIWITGESQSGKTTVMEQIIKPTIGSIAMPLQSTSTEAGIRESMGNQARPIIFDEAEQGDSMDKVVELARSSSRPIGNIVKYQQKSNIRSCFCFSSIHDSVKKHADSSRITNMRLLKNNHPQSHEQFKGLKNMIAKTITREFSKRLLARTVSLLPTLQENYCTIRDEAAIHLDSSRDADQISSMLSGFILLMQDEPITSENARKILEKYDWEDHTAITQTTEPERLLEYICTSIVRIDSTHGVTQQSIGTLIASAANKISDVDRDVADRALRHYGIVVNHKGASIQSRNQNLSRLLKDTDWSFKWNDTLRLLPGSETKKNVYVMPGVKQQRGVWLPIKYFYDHKEKMEDEGRMPLEDTSVVEEIKF